MKNLVLVASLMLGTSAQAATLMYDYQGQTLSGGRCGGSCGYAFSGSLELNEDLFPGGQVAGSQLEIIYDSGENDITMNGGSYIVRSAGDTFEGTFSDMDLPDFVETGGDIDGVIFSIISGVAGFRWTFGEDREIVDWGRFGDGLSGGSEDFSISSNGDFVADGSEAGPGTWTLTVTDAVPAPSPVPLPAGAFLLVGALGALGVSARKRKARG